MATTFFLSCEKFLNSVYRLFNSIRSGLFTISLSAWSTDKEPSLFADERVVDKEDSTFL